MESADSIPYTGAITCTNVTRPRVRLVEFMQTDPGRKVDYFASFGVYFMFCTLVLFRKHSHLCTSK